MKADYNYQKVEQVHEQLKEKGYHHLETYEINNIITNRIEFWVGDGEHILLEVYSDNHCGIYKDTNEI